MLDRIKQKYGDEHVSAAPCLGWLAKKSGSFSNLEEQRAYADHALRLSSNEEALCQLGTALRNLGEHEASLLYFERQLEALDVELKGPHIRKTRASDSDRRCEN